MPVDPRTDGGDEHRQFRDTAYGRRRQSATPKPTLADAVLAECTASSTGAGTTKVTLVNPTIQLLGALTPVPLDSFPAANAPVLNLGALLALTLNVQPPATIPPPPAGSVGATALDLSVLGGVLGAPPLVHLTVGTVTCGPNAVSPAAPAPSRRAWAEVGPADDGPPSHQARGANSSTGGPKPKWWAMAATVRSAAWPSP